MADPILKSSRSKTIAFVIFGLLIIAIISYCIIGVIVSSKNDDAQIKIAEQMPSYIRKLLGSPEFGDIGKNFDGIVSTNIDNSEKFSFSKYVYFEDNIKSSNNYKLNAAPDKAINEKLHMPANMLAEQMDGIILQKNNFLNVGFYVSENGEKPRAKHLNHITP